MLKIFTTQLTGLFKRIDEKEELNIEDGARVLAQAAVGDGIIYVYGVEEMEAVTLEATISEEPLPYAKPFVSSDDITSVDRVLLVSRFSTNEKVIKVAKQLQEKGIPTVSIGTIPKEVESESVHSITDVHIDTKLLKPLIPGEDGIRFGFPATMTALYAYHGLAFTMKEMIEEYE
ncbi:DUF2529 domain-containing protein [Bacillus sp. CGMCC 1.16541]|uniref:DUF2529 domain-containing protein n=1 Tax=Bacillus sp. CGMCC 1.16541 TaxID=2185143 RepID=UPI000D728A84|nr:DUF2529 domain-containing protein [Bacillus sp. CGMCC 1.16541]